MKVVIHDMVYITLNILKELTHYGIILASIRKDSRFKVKHT